MIKVFAALLGLATSGCGAVCACNIYVPHTPFPPAYTGSPIPTPSPTPALVTSIDENYNHKTVTLAQGTMLVVILNSTYWNFADGMYNHVLQQVGAGETSPCAMGTSVPGSGCGFVSREFLAANPGSTMVVASRTSCGEAMGCTGNQGSFSVTIVVN
jgi:hypothetical protein